MTLGEQGPVLREKVALITGSTRGIGRAIAEAMAGAGASVIINGRMDEAAQTVAGELQRQGHRAEALAVDLSQPDAPESLMSRAFEIFPAIDILVNNAGISPVVCPPERLTPQQWDSILHVNLTVPFRLSQLWFRHMVQSARPGVMLSVSSVGGMVALSGLAAYAASKSGLIGLTRALARDWARHGIRVNAIAPGYVTTELTEGVRSSDGYYQSIISRTPLERLGTPAEVAGAAVFLASDQASYITGHVLAVDGGWLAV